MADLINQTSPGGQYSTALAGTTTEQLVYTGNGRLNALSFITIGTVTVSIYDGTQSTGGTLIYTSATNPTAGTTLALNWPIANGICVKGSSTAGHGLAIAYSKGGVNGN